MRDIIRSEFPCIKQLKPKESHFMLFVAKVSALRINRDGVRPVRTAAGAPSAISLGGSGATRV